MTLKRNILPLLTFLLISNQAASHNNVVVIPLGDEPAPRTNMISGDENWSCAFAESCQDVYEFSVDESGSAVIRVDSITGNSTLRMALYGPGDDLGGLNLLTDNNNDLECLRQNARFENTISLSSPGTYKLAVTRDWGSSAGFVGTYSLTLATTVPRIDIGQVVNDENSMAEGISLAPCSDENLTSGDGSWFCALLESCQDVYEFSIGEPGSAVIDINSVTGSSALRLALYAPNVSLGETNLLTGNLNDLECDGQNAGFNTTIDLPFAGIYQLAIGRDWESSAGFNGLYNLQLYTSVPRTDLGQTINDVDTLAAGSVTGNACP